MFWTGLASAFIDGSLSLFKMSFVRPMFAMSRTTVCTILGRRRVQAQGPLRSRSWPASAGPGGRRCCTARSPARPPLRGTPPPPPRATPDGGRPPAGWGGLCQGIWPGRPARMPRAPTPAALQRSPVRAASKLPNTYTLTNRANHGWDDNHGWDEAAPDLRRGRAAEEGGPIHLLAYIAPPRGAHRALADVVLRAVNSVAIHCHNRQCRALLQHRWPCRHRPSGGPWVSVTETMSLGIVWRRSGDRPLTEAGGQRRRGEMEEGRMRFNQASR